MLVGTLLLAAVGAYALWASLARGRAGDPRLGAARAGAGDRTCADRALGDVDLSLSCAVLWWLLPASAHIRFITFLGVYAAAVIAGIVSHVPGGVGVFEAVILLTLPDVPADALLGSLLAYRAVYYLVPLVFGTLLFGSQGAVGAARPPRAGAASSRASTSRRSCRRSPARLTFLAGALLLFSGRDPGGR